MPPTTRPPARAIIRSRRPASAARARAASARQPASDRAARPIARAGPDTAQGPRASAIRAAVPGSATAKPRRRPASP
ncbi:hypothetical protein SR39_07820 [Methylobacterium radiotolerans]|nr:hypothetical protein SR39_07820 [Methylobacterium radiotolerans]